MTTELQIPYYEAWLGPWAILPDALTQTLELFRKTDLHIHLQQQAIQQAARGSYRQTAGVISLTGKLMKQRASMGGGTSRVQQRRRMAWSTAGMAQWCASVCSKPGTIQDSRRPSLIHTQGSLAKARSALGCQLLRLWRF